MTNYGADCLYRNEAGRRFEDITGRAGLSGSGWSSSAGFLDYDADGFLDLFVTRYLDYDPAVTAVDDGGLPEYPSPSSFDGLPTCSTGTSATAPPRRQREDRPCRPGRPGAGGGLHRPRRRWQGGHLRGHDGDPNFAWINTGSGRFEERARVLGVAVNAYGQPEAGMGIALGDSDLDGSLDSLSPISFRSRTPSTARGHPGSSRTPPPAAVWVPPASTAPPSARPSRISTTTGTWTC